VVDRGTVIGKVSPATFLTKICMVSSASAEEAREDVEVMDEKLLERMMMTAIR